MNNDYDKIIHVRDLLLWKSLPGLFVLAGDKGLHRSISSVSVMDAPDICDWMKGGEFLITSGFIIKNYPINLEKLITELSSRQVAALGIKVDRFIQELPEHVIKVANNLHFPILYIPQNYSWVDIINPILSEIINNQAVLLTYSEKIHDCFIKLALGGKGIQEVIDFLSTILEKQVLFEDRVFRRRFLSKHMDAQNAERNGDVNFAVSTTERIFGKLFVFGEKGSIPEKYERISLERASNVLILMLQEEMSNREIEYQYRSELINDILFGKFISSETIDKRAALYGWKFKKGVRVIVYMVKNPYDFGKYKNTRESNEMRKSIINIINNNFCFLCYYTHYNDSIIYIIEYAPINEDDFKHLFLESNRTIVETIEKETGCTVTIGVGDYKTKIEESSRSYKEAKLAIRIGRLLGRKTCVTFYNDLGIYTFLHEINIYKRGKGRDFIMETLGPLIDYERKSKNQLYKTLITLVESDWNLAKASQEMNVHYNTIKYRFNKIEKILNLDFSCYEDKLKVGLSIFWKNIDQI